MKKMVLSSRSNLAVHACVTLFLVVCPVRAGIIYVSLQKFLEYSQTSSAAPSNQYAGAYLVAESNPGDFDGASVTYPGAGSPAMLPQTGAPGNFVASQFFSTQANMDAAFPFGTYTYALSNSITSATETTSLSYTGDDYPSDVPALNPATFVVLQGMNPSLPFTFNYNSFTPDPNATTNGVFLEVVGPGVFFTSFSPDSTVMPANTLATGTTYQWGLDFGDEITSLDPNTGVETVLDFERETFGSFTTASSVPEPSTFIPVAMAMFAAVGTRLRKRAR